MLIALGGMPCLPEELGYLAPRVTIEMPPVSEAPVVAGADHPPPPAAARKVAPPRPGEAIRYRVMYGVLR